MSPLSEAFEAWAQGQRESWALALADSDRALMKLRDEEHLTFERIGTRYGISRVAARQRYLKALRREAIRQALPAKV